MKKILRSANSPRFPYLLLPFLFVFVLPGYSQSEAPIWPSVFSSPVGTFEEIQQDFEEYWKDKEPSKGQGYNPFKRWEAYVFPRIYPSMDMTLPSTTYHNYMEWLENQQNQEANKTSTANWSSKGPFTKATGDDTGVGRVNFVRFNPGYNGTTNNTIFIGAPDGGLWKSINGGASWTTHTDFLGVIGVADLAIDPTNTNIMYLATGDREGDRRSIGVLKSTDGGATWNPTSLTWTATDNYKMRKMIMHPSNPLIMLAVTDGGVFRTTDGWLNWDNPSPIISLHDIEFKPTDPTTVYAAGSQFIKSTDNGATWSTVSAGLPASADVVRMNISVTAADNDYVYVITGKSVGNGLEGIYRSTNSATSFSVRFNPANTIASPNILGSNADGTSTTGQANYDLAMAVSPINADIVTTGGINQWQSTDGGTSWTLTTHWKPIPPTFPTKFVHADIHYIVYEPGVNTNNTTLFTCGDGGISKSTNNGATWTDISNNLVITQQNRIGISSLSNAGSADLYIAGLQDIGSIGQLNGPGTWKIIGGGDGEDCFIDRTDDMTLVFAGTNGYYQRSDNGGATFTDIDGIPDGEFFSPIKQDPVDASTYYAGGRTALYRSPDKGATWTSLSSTPFGTDKIEEFRIAPSNPMIIYAIKFDAMAKSVNGGSSWTTITGTLPVGSASLSNLAISDTDPDKVWVTFSGYSATNKVYYSANGGTSWQNVSVGLPNIPINNIVYQKGNTNGALYIAADIGVYYRNNQSPLANAWVPFSTGLPNVSVRDLKIYYPTLKLRIATYGRGTWESDLFSPLPVDLTGFSGENKDLTNELSWSVVAENNLDYYVIERGENGVTFEAIGEIQPQSTNPSGGNQYDFSDTKPFYGINYYRLKIIDLDGEFEYSKVISLFVDDANDAITIFPNPAINFVEVQGVNAAKTTLNIMDVRGRSVSFMKLPASNKIDVSRFPNGTYFIEIKVNGKREAVKRFIKK